MRPVAATMQARRPPSALRLWRGSVVRWQGECANFQPCDPSAPCLILILHSIFSALKIGGVEVPRERWDEAEAEPEDDDAVPMVVDSTPPLSTRSILPDWTRSPLPHGAPPANASQVQQQPMVVVSTPQTAVGA